MRAVNKPRPLSHLALLWPHHYAPDARRFIATSLLARRGTISRVTRYCSALGLVVLITSIVLQLGWDSYVADVALLYSIAVLFSVFALGIGPAILAAVTA